MKTNNLNEKKIKLSDFKGVGVGLNRFKILDAEYDEIPTRNGNKEVVRLDVELIDNLDRTKRLQISNHILFIDLNTTSQFHRFVQSITDALGTEDFSPKAVIGLEGRVTLSHYRPEGSDFTFNRLNGWTFDAPESRVSEELESYVESQLQEDREIADDGTEIGVEN